MARPPKEVSTEEEGFLRTYLNRAVGDPAKESILKGGSRLLALKELTQQRPDQVTALQEWINTWLTSEARRKMWAALRQHNYKKRHSVRMVSLTNDAYEMLNYYSKRHKMTFSQTVEKLVEKEKSGNTEK